MINGELNMTAEECIERIEEILGKDITVSEVPQFLMDGTSITIMYPVGKETLMRLVEISDIIKEWRKKNKNKSKNMEIEYVLGELKNVDPSELERY